MNPFKKQFEGETARHLRALWDYYLAGCSVQKLVELYEQSERPPTKSYKTLTNWKNRFCWEERATEYQELLIEQDKIEFEKARQKWVMKQIDLLEDHQEAINQTTVDVDGVSMNQYTNAIKTQIGMIQAVFDVEPVARIAPTTPDGKKSYQIDLSELLKLADAVKRRPE